jgi:uncharacterized protein (UPF0332 family)
VTAGAELLRHRLARARETLDEARLMAESGHWNGCVNRLYYGCFYAVSALLLSKNLSSSKHTGVRSLFSIHFVQPGIFPKELAALYNTLFDARQESDYEDFFRADPEEIRQWLPLAERFIQTAARLLEP